MQKKPAVAADSLLLQGAEGRHLATCSAAVTEPVSKLEFPAWQDHFLVLSLPVDLEVDPRAH